LSLYINKEVRGEFNHLKKVERERRGEERNEREGLPFLLREIRHYLVDFKSGAQEMLDTRRIVHENCLRTQPSA